MTMTAKVNPYLPKYLGVNDLGVEVWRIKEGGRRPLVDDQGAIACKACRMERKPRRLTFGKDCGFEWGALACPREKCGQIHCILHVVPVFRSRADGADVGTVLAQSAKKVDVDFAVEALGTRVFQSGEPGGRCGWHQCNEPATDGVRGIFLTGQAIRWFCREHAERTAACKWNDGRIERWKVAID